MPVNAQATKPAPRLSNGKPDFTGVWDHPRVGDISRNVDGPCAGGSKGCKNLVSGDLTFTPAGKAEWDKNNKPTTYDWMGTSVGRWEGDTLVIQTAGFNGRTWLDTAQHPHSDALRLTIRMTRPDYDHLNWEVTIEDPKYYIKPIKNVRTFVLMAPGTELFEYSCSENNRCEGGKCVAADVQKDAR
jgi:hypothetical protein